MEAITGFLEDFDFAKLLPEIGKLLGSLRLWIGVIMALGPLVLLAIGLWYYFRPEPKPHETRGFRLKYAMESPRIWRYTQRVAALVRMIAGGGMTLISVVICLVCLGVDELALMLVAAIWLALQLILVPVSNLVIGRIVRKHFQI